MESTKRTILLVQTAWCFYELCACHVKQFVFILCMIFMLRSHLMGQWMHKKASQCLNALAFGRTEFVELPLKPHF